MCPQQPGGESAESENGGCVYGGVVMYVWRMQGLSRLTSFFVGLFTHLSVRLPAPEQEERAVFFSRRGNSGSDSLDRKFVYFVFCPGEQRSDGEGREREGLFFYNVNLFRTDELRPNSTWTRQLSASARAHPFLFRSPMIHAQGVNRNPPTRPRRQIWVGLFTLRASRASKTVPFSCTRRC